jgi:tetratricopeptide (TPR) repeat protein
MYGVLLATTGHDDEAQEVLLSAAAELEEFGDREEAYVAYNFLGDIQRRRGDLAEALNLYERARLLVLEHGGYLPEALRKKAQVYLLLGNIDAAEKDAEEAARIVAGDDWATVASTQMVLGQVRAARGRDEEAELHFREALRVMGTVDFSSWEEEITFAEFLLRRGRTDEGNEMVERAVASARRIGPASPLPEFLERRATAAREAGASGAPGDRGGG